MREKWIRPARNSRGQDRHSGGIQDSVYTPSGLVGTMLSGSRKKRLSQEVAVWIEGFGIFLFKTAGVDCNIFGHEVKFRKDRSEGRNVRR